MIRKREKQQIWAKLNAKQMDMKHNAPYKYRMLKMKKLMTIQQAFRQLNEKVNAHLEQEKENENA